MFTQRGSVLTASDAATGDNYGRSSALSGNGSVLVVGAFLWESGALTNQGGIYTYDWSGSAWVQRGSVLAASDAAASDLFGASVALSADGNILVVGAYSWEGSATDQGGVYIYDWSGSAWVQRGSVLTASDAAASDYFGISVALSDAGTVLAVGASTWEGSATDQGGVYVYDWSGSAWVQRGSVLVAVDAAISDSYGISVALSGNASVLVVGAFAWEGTATDQGGVYVYDWSGSAWVQRGSVLTASDSAATDNYGVSVAVSGNGNILVVGAYNWEGSFTNQGGVYIYDWSGSAWVQRGSVLTASDAAASDQYGISVALSSDGNILVVGAFAWEGSLTDQGGVYIYVWSLIQAGFSLAYGNNLEVRVTAIYGDALEHQLSIPYSEMVESAYLLAYHDVIEQTIGIAYDDELIRVRFDAVYADTVDYRVDLPYEDYLDNTIILIFSDALETRFSLPFSAALGTRFDLPYEDAFIRAEFALVYGDLTELRYSLSNGNLIESTWSLLLSDVLECYFVFPFDILAPSRLNTRYDISFGDVPQQFVRWDLLYSSYSDISSRYDLIYDLDEAVNLSRQFDLPYGVLATQDAQVQSGLFTLRTTHG